MPPLNNQQALTKLSDDKKQEQPVDFGMFDEKVSEAQKHRTKGGLSISKSIFFSHIYQVLVYLAIYYI